MNELEAGLRAIIAEVAELDDPSQIDPDASLRSLGIDSMKGLEVILLVEERLGIEVPEKALYEFRSLADMLAYTQR